MNSIYSFQRYDNICFIDRNILQHIFGNVSEHFQSEMVEIIKQHMDKLKCMKISMDLKDQYELNSLPVVFIEYLQILKAHDAHMTDKKAVDYNVFRLKQFSRDFKIPIVILSSMNRISYSDVISRVALKELECVDKVQK
ncbi:MAG: hypothetical protein IJK81_09060 [Selenomonadaceae bacterium]|nr:hypothetical protein [Selenomonadaceae bacterium]